MKFKKGFMLADTMLSMVVMAMAVTSLLVFINSLQNMDKTTANKASLALNSLHSKIYMIDHESIGDDDGDSGIDSDTDLLSVFSLFKEDKVELKKLLSGEMPTYSIGSGLKLNFNLNSFPCARFLLSDFGFSKVSKNGVDWDFKNNVGTAGVLSNLSDTMNYCDDLTIVSGKKNIYFKD